VSAGGVAERVGYPTAAARRRQSLQKVFSNEAADEARSLEEDEPPDIKTLDSGTILVAEINRNLTEIRQGFVLVFAGCLEGGETMLTIGYGSRQSSMRRATARLLGGQACFSPSKKLCRRPFGSKTEGSL
jgi:hypothetical protein